MLVMRVSEHLFNYLLNKKLIFLLAGPHRPDGLSRVKVVKQDAKSRLKIKH